MVVGAACSIALLPLQHLVAGKLLLGVGLVVALAPNTPYTSWLLVAGLGLGSGLALVELRLDVVAVVAQTFALFGVPALGIRVRVGLLHPPLVAAVLASLAAFASSADV